MNSSGIYFLILNNKVVYIGQTTNLKLRLIDHRHKQYDRFRFIECPFAMLTHYETRWIKKFRPVLNKQHLGSGPVHDNGLYIKLPERLKIHASKWAKDRGGLSKVVRDLLVKETKFKEPS
jgi:hypothetical protein